MNLYKTLQKLPKAARKSHLQGTLERLREIERGLKNKSEAKIEAKEEEEKAEAEGESKIGEDQGNGLSSKEEPDEL